MSKQLNITFTGTVGIKYFDKPYVGHYKDIIPLAMTHVRYNFLEPPKAVRDYAL